MTVMLIFFLLGASVIVQSSGLSEMISMNASDREAKINKLLPAKEALLMPFRAVGAATGKRYFTEVNSVISEDGQIYKTSCPTDPDFAADHAEALYETCKEQGIDFLYVIIPGKPLYDKDIELYGLDCARNLSADLGREAFQSRGVPVLDLRDAFREELKKSGDTSAIFYRTDHHWNTDAGLMAARLISNDLNERFGMSLRVDNIDDETVDDEGGESDSSHESPLDTDDSEDIDDRDRIDMKIFSMENSDILPLEELLIEDEPQKLRIEGKGKIIYYYTFAKFTEDFQGLINCPFKDASLYINGV